MTEKSDVLPEEAAGEGKMVLRAHQCRASPSHWPRQQGHRPSSLEGLRVAAVDNALMLWALTNVTSSHLSNASS